MKVETVRCRVEEFLGVGAGSRGLGDMDKMKKDGIVIVEKVIHIANQRVEGGNLVLEVLPSLETDRLTIQGHGPYVIGVYQPQVFVHNVLTYFINTPLRSLIDFCF